jgi:hypothetical protein
MKRKTTKREKRVFKYLNLLRESGQTNMYGAVPYIQSAFGISYGESKDLLILWMDVFNNEGNYEEIEIKEKSTK